MCRFETILEVRKRPHKLSHIFARSGIDGVPDAQIPDEACEEAFGGAHSLKRKVRDIVAHAGGQVTHLVPQERTEVDVLEDEFHAFDILIETRALCREYACTATRLVIREGEKSPEKCERHEDEDQIGHG
jgi:hypothetical protein